MNKKLPKVFVNNKAELKDNNQLSSYNKNKEEIINDIDVNSEIVNKIVINKKISNLFNSSNFVYKVDAVITTKDGFKTETLISKNMDNLITIDNKYIPIDSIIDIQ